MSSPARQQPGWPVRLAVLVVCTVPVAGLWGDPATAAPTPSPGPPGGRASVELGVVIAPSPSGTHGPSPTSTGTVRPTPGASGTGGPISPPHRPTPGGGGSLPRTGAAIAAMLAAGGALVAVGGVLRVAGRRRSECR